MSFEAWRTVGLWTDVVSGIVFLALGIFVATRRPHRRVNVLFAVYAISFGGFHAVTNLGPGYLAVAGTWTAGVAYALLFPWTIALTWLGFRMLPRRATVQAPLLIAGAVLIWWTFLDMTAPDAAAVYDGLPSRLVAIPDSAAFLSMLLVPLMMAWTAHRATGPRHAAVASAVVLWPAAYAGASFAATVGTHAWWYWLPAMLLVLLIAATWTRHTPRPYTRNAALATTTAPLAGILLVLLTDPPEPTHSFDLGLMGLLRIAGVFILAYTILRHQLFDIDLRIKWTLKQSTIAAAFIAVFFFVSELAQTIFSDRIGPYLGILAAALLVFAIAPLQRFAGRLSDRAMPRAGHDEHKRDAYRQAYATAWADGAMTKEEMRHLEGLRRFLDLSADDYAAIEREVAAPA